MLSCSPFTSKHILPDLGHYFSSSPKYNKVGSNDMNYLTIHAFHYESNEYECWNGLLVLRDYFQTYASGSGKMNEHT